MASSITRNVEILLRVSNQTATGIAAVKQSFVALQGSIDVISKTLDGLSGKISGLGNAFKGVNLTNSGIDAFATSLKELSKVDPSKIQTISNALATLNGVKIDPSLSIVATTLTSLSNISKFPSFKGVIELLQVAGTTKPPPDISAFVNSIKGFSEFTVPKNITSLGKFLQDLKGFKSVGEFPNLAPITAGIVTLSKIKTLPNVSKLAEGLQKFSGLTGASFPDFNALADGLRKFDGIKLPSNLTLFAKGLGELVKLQGKFDHTELGKLADSLRGFSAIGKIPPMGRFVKAIQDLAALKVPGLPVITAEVLKLSIAFSKLASASPLIVALQQIQSSSVQAAAAVEQVNRNLQQQSRFLHDIARRFKTYVGYRIVAETVFAISNAMAGGQEAILEYSQSLANLRAITGATAEESVRMGLAIEKVVSTTRLSLKEVADGMVILGQAGLNAEESIAAIGPTAALATGTLSDMATAVDLITSAMAVFNINAEDAGRIADVFANAINFSKLTVEKLVTALNYVGPVAADLGISLEETATALSILSNAGLRASTMGTGLRRILGELAAPTEKLKKAVAAVGLQMEDVDPRMNSFEDMLRNLGYVLSDTSVAFDLFGKYGASAALALSSAAQGGFQEMLDQISRYGATQEMARQQMEGLRASLRNMQNNFQLVAVAIGKAGAIDAMKRFLDYLTQLAKGMVYLVDNGIRPLISALNSFRGAMGGGLIADIISMTGAIVGLTYAMGGLNKSTGIFATIKASEFGQGISKATQNVKGLTKVGVTLRALFTAMGGWVTVGIAAIAGFLVIVGKVINRNDRLIETLEKSKIEYEDNTNKVKGYTAELERLSKVPMNDRERAELMSKMTKEFPELSAEIRATGGDLEKLTELMNDYQESLDTKNLEEVRKGLDGYVGKMQSAAGKIRQIQAKLNAPAWELDPKSKFYDPKAVDDLKKMLQEAQDEYDKWVKNVVVSIEELRKNKIAVDWSTVLDKTGFDANIKAIEAALNEMTESTTKGAKQAGDAMLGLAAKWRDEMAKGKNIQELFIKDMAGDVSDIIKNEDILSLTPSVDKADFNSAVQKYVQGIHQLNIKIIEAERATGKERLLLREQIDKEALALDNMYNKQGLQDNAVWLLNQQMRLQEWYDQQKKIRQDAYRNDANALAIAMESLERETRAKVDAIRQGYTDIDVDTVLKEHSVMVSTKEHMEEQYFQKIDRERAENLLSEREANKKKLEYTLDRLTKEYEATKSMYELIAKQKNDPAEKAKAKKELEEVLADLEKVRTEIAQEETKNRIEDLKYGYEKQRVLAETAMQRQVEGIAKLEEEGVVTHGEALSKKSALELQYYEESIAAANAHLEMLKEQEGIEGDSYKEALKHKLDLDQEYAEFRAKTLEDAVADQKKANDDLKELEKDKYRNVQDYANKILNENKDYKNKTIGEEKNYAEQISEINETLNEKLEDLDRDLRDKRKEYAKQRKEAEQEAAASIVVTNAELDNKIRDIQNRGKSDTHKERDAEKDADKRMVEGIAQIRKAREESDGAALEAGKELLKQAEELYGESREKAAVKGINNLKRAFAEAASTGEQLKGEDIAEEEGKAEEAYDFERTKALANHTDEMSDLEAEHVAKIEAIDLEFNRAMEQEVLRHTRVMEDYEAEKVKLNDVLTSTQSIITSISSNGEGTILSTVSKMAEGIKQSMNEVTSKIVTVSAQVTGMDLLQQAKSVLDGLTDKVITVTVNYVQSGNISSEAKFNGGLIQGFSKGGSVFRKLASPFVSIGSLFKDSVPAMLSKNEFVHRAKAVREYGPRFMRKVNNLEFPKTIAKMFAEGGPVSPESVAALSGAISLPNFTEALKHSMKSSIDNSSINTYNVHIGDKALRPRGKVASLTTTLLTEVKKRY